MDRVLDRIIDTEVSADDLESLVRPFLELLREATGLESTYLTSIDLDRNEQAIEYARNALPDRLEIPEGLRVPWGDTLCRRALDEGRGYCEDVAADWGDSDAARDLGIATYLSEPVRVGDGELFGTLCAASGDRRPVSEGARRLLRLFAVLVARQIERERLLERLRSEHDALEAEARVDPLTGLPNRRAATEALHRALANAARGGAPALVAYVDLDDFKRVNDVHGHEAGDRLLVTVARRWREGLRSGDLVARLGGDEFVVVAMAFGDDAEAEADALRERVAELATGRFDLGVVVLDYAGPSVGAVASRGAGDDAESVLRRADRAMYAAKVERRRGG